MKKTQSEEEKAIRDLTCQIHEFEMGQIPPVESLREKYKLSDLFFHKMEMLMRKQERKAKRRKRLHGIVAAAAVLLIVMLILRPQYFVEAGRWVIRWFEDHVEFRFQEDSGVNWIPRYTMEYVPEGYVMEVVEYYLGAGVIECYNEKRQRISFVYCTVDGLMDMDNENKEFLILEREGTEIYYLKAKNEEEYSYMTWVSEDETTVLSIDGVLPEEELLKIWENITVVEENCTDK